MPSVVLREKTVNYELGEHEPPDDGKRLLFIHGDNGSLSSWEQHLNEFSQHHDTYALDLPGHGASVEAPADSVHAYRDSLADFIEGMALEPAVLIGHSIGALAALALGAHNPDLVEGLVLVSMYTRWRPPQARLKALSQAVETGGTLPFEPGLYSPAVSERVLQLARRQQERGRAETLLMDLNAAAAYDATVDLVRVKQPTLFVVGADDTRIRAREAEELAEALPAASVAAIDRAGHEPMLEQAHAFQEAVAAFLHTF